MQSARIIKDRVAAGVMLFLMLSIVSLVLLIGIGLYVKSSPLLSEHSLSDLLFTSGWKPMKNQFGFMPFLAGTIWVTGIAVLISLPVALLSAICLTEYSHRALTRIIYPALDILAGIPSVIYGLWGVLIVVPYIGNKLAPMFGVYTAGYTVLAAGIVLGVMILPLLISLFVEIFRSVPQELRDVSSSLGATKWQTIKKVVLRKTFPGVAASVVLAVSRAFGETIAVLMVCGNLPIAPNSPLDSGYPLPALIANNYGEMLSMPLYESALMFAAFILFFVIMLFNLISRIVLYRIERSFV